MTVTDPGPAGQSEAGDAGRSDPVDGDDHEPVRLADGARASNLIVGIGASAGDIDALKSVFSKVPARSGLAFIVVQHLDPNCGSALVSIIVGSTDMPVCLAEHGGR